MIQPPLPRLGTCFYGFMGLWVDVFVGSGGANLPTSRLELFLVIPENEPKRYMVEPHAVNPPRVASSNENHVKMLALAGVGHVNDTVGLHLFDTVSNGGQIRTALSGLGFRARRLRFGV